MEAGLKSIRDDMATGFRAVRDEMATHKDLLEVRDDVRRLNEIMVSKADLSETIRRELDASPFVTASEVKDLNERMLRVEEAVGIKTEAARVVHLAE